MRLAHAWRLDAPRDLPREVVRDYLQPAVRAVPRSMAARLGACRIAVGPELAHPDIGSLWRRHEDALEILLASAEVEAHDLAMELYVCLGQALWEAAEPGERRAWVELLGEEIAAGVTGEIDEAALEEKRRLLESAITARSRRRLERYARASFAGTAAEYIHCFWHDVTVRTGLEHLPAEPLRRRLEMLARWFPPDPGQKLFAAEG